MTVGDDFIPVEEGQELDEPAYPTVFGISLTPVVSGIGIAVLGLVGAVFMGLNLVSPAWQKSKELQNELTGLKDQVAQKQAKLQNIEKLKADLNRSKTKQKELLSLFANESTLDTLLLDLNKVIEARNQGVEDGAIKARLVVFEPDLDKSGPINDGSLGAELNGRFKRKVVKVEVKGTFSHMRLIMLNIERLQPLLLVKNFESNVDIQRVGPGDTTVVVAPDEEPEITTNFELHALIPMTAQEIANLESKNKGRKKK